MAYKALVSFAGAVSMAQGEVIDKIEPEIAKDLLKAGYIEEVGSGKTDTDKTEKAVKPAKTKKGGS
jgi:hypothetical protein